jgi:hypothetical protein
MAVPIIKNHQTSGFSASFMARIKAEQSMSPCMESANDNGNTVLLEVAAQPELLEVAAQPEVAAEPEVEARSDVAAETKSGTVAVGEAESVTTTAIPASDTASDTPPVKVKPAPEVSLLFRALWRNFNIIHQLWVMDKVTGKFILKHAGSIENAVKLAMQYSAEGYNVFFAIAEYENAYSRKAENAKGAWGFWADIDVGAEKAAAGKGYETLEEATEAVAKFCADTGVPKPNIVVNSGGGLHVYWVLDKFVPKELWQQYAQKLKALTHAVKFLADDSRTADISSILRALGTLNYKYTPPRPVTLLEASETFIEQAGFCASIDAAHDKLCPVAAAKAASPACDHANGNADNAERYPPDLARLASALATLDPDCDDLTWKLRIIAPMSRAAYLYPEQADGLRKLAIAFSSGRLRGTPSEKWKTPGQNNSPSGEQAFDGVWDRFHNDKGTGKRTSLGTINHMAKEAGWVYTRTASQNNADEFEQIAPPAKQSHDVAKTAALAASEEVAAASGADVPVSDNADAGDAVMPETDDTGTTSLTTAGTTGSYKSVDGTFMDGTLEEASPIWVMNNMFAFVEEYASIYRLEFRNFIDPTKFKTQFNNQVAKITVNGKTHSYVLGTAWINSPERRQHKSLVIRPAEGAITEDNCFNEWQGYVIAAAPGNVKPFLRLMVRLVPNRAARRYMQRWMAHLIQHPEVKMFVALVVWSLIEGVGKNLIFESLVSIIGAVHSKVISQEDLDGDFNSWAINRIFIVGDEVLSSDKRQQHDKMKGLITGTTLTINEKYQPKRDVPNLLNFAFLSNNNDALYMSDNDRRYFVWEVEAGRLSQKQIDDFLQWRDSGGLAHLHHFLSHYPLGDFNPRAPAPMTSAKKQMTDDNRSDLEAWLADLMASDVTQVFGRELATATEIGKQYGTDTGHNVPSSKAIVGACKRLGAYARPDQVRLVKGKKVRPLALAKVAYWKAQTEAVWAEEMAKETPINL